MSVIGNNTRFTSKIFKCNHSHSADCHEQEFTALFVVTPVAGKDKESNHQTDGSHQEAVLGGYPRTGAVARESGFEAIFSII